MPRKVEDIIPKEKRTIREVTSPTRSAISATANTTAKKKKKVIELDGEEQVPIHLGEIDNRIDSKTKARVEEQMEGSTLIEARKTLLDKGAMDVFAFTIAH
jgi:phospholipase/lecithinase/hemolysin